MYRHCSTRLDARACDGIVPWSWPRHLPSAERCPPPGGAIAVTPDNFTRAEVCDFVKRGSLGKFVHLRKLPLEGTGV